MPTFTALFNDRNEAERAQADLGRLGVGASDVSIHDQQSAGLGSSSETSRDEGGFFAGLRDMFVPDEDSQTYGEGLRRGHVLLTVRASDERAEQVHQALENSSAVDVDESASSWRNQGWGGPATTDRQAIGSGFGATGQTSQASSQANSRTDEVIPIVEEQLAVGKREVNRGGVRVRSYVKETPVHEQVSLREEHVEIDRHAVNQPLRGDAGDAFQERTIEMTETAEEAVVAKQARVVEEVGIHKEVGSRVEQIDDTVRRTDVEVERLGDTDRTTDGERGAMFRDTDRNDRR